MAGAGLTKDRTGAADGRPAQREFPGVSFDYSQNIEDNIDEALSGVKGSNSVKVFGPDLDSRRVDRQPGRRGDEQGARHRRPGGLSLAGPAQLLITPDRAQCARYGLNVGDVAAMVQAAIGGQAVTQVSKAIAASIWSCAGSRSIARASTRSGKFALRCPTGGQIPLAQVAEISTAEGASFIYREGLERYVPVRFAVRGRDLQSAVEDAKKTVAAQVKLPEGVHLRMGRRVRRAAGRPIAA